MTECGAYAKSTNMPCTKPGQEKYGGRCHNHIGMPRMIEEEEDIPIIPKISKVKSRNDDLEEIKDLKLVKNIEKIKKLLELVDNFKDNINTYSASGMHKVAMDINHTPVNYQGKFFTSEYPMPNIEILLNRMSQVLYRYRADLTSYLWETDKTKEIIAKDVVRNLNIPELTNEIHSILNYVSKVIQAVRKQHNIS